MIIISKEDKWNNISAEKPCHNSLKITMRIFKGIFVITVSFFFSYGRNIQRKKLQKSLRGDEERKMSVKRPCVMTVIIQFFLIN